ncbi:hypothetical protein [Paenibacillus sp. 1011MAR3C5]|uniref:hypothetical protein n=1 Tax=Paenibacillus sp. 1011MAR3C5 TaxID=1675787 RepID=UPI002175BF42|nr:hypothetical protein [Paenibacillus sp. 1011MAR3C5]
MKNLAWLKGFVYGILLSGIVPLIFMFIAQALAGGITSLWGESWFYFAALIPFVLTSSILGHVLYHKKEMTNKTKWLVS